MKQYEPSMEGLEAKLRQYRLAHVPPVLRRKILDAAFNEKPPPMELALRGAMTFLVVVLAWAQWMERGTAERMAQVAAASQTGQGPLPSPEYQTAGWLEKAVLHPRMRLPLPPGQASTRVTIRISSIPAMPIGEDQ